MEVPASLPTHEKAEKEQGRSSVALRQTHPLTGHRAVRCIVCMISVVANKSGYSPGPEHVSLEAASCCDYCWAPSSAKYKKVSILEVGQKSDTSQRLLKLHS